MAKDSPEMIYENVQTIPKGELLVCNVCCKIQKYKCKCTFCLEPIKLLEKQIIKTVLSDI